MAGITFESKPYDMTDEYLWLCNGGGMIVPLYASDEQLDFLQQSSDMLGLSLVDFLNGLAPVIEDRITELCRSGS